MFYPPHKHKTQHLTANRNLSDNAFTIPQSLKSQPTLSDVLAIGLNYFFPHLRKGIKHDKCPGRVAQSVTCLATDACLTANPGVASSIPARSHTFMETDHEIISTVILLPSADSFKKGCCQLQAKVCA